jgi:RNA polymerase sigma factor (sigma-70 family)
MDQDSVLAVRAAAGDAAAFTALVRSHEGAIRRFLRRLSGDSAHDLAQETFIRAWRAGAGFRGDGSYRSWLMGIAWSTFLTARRADARRLQRERDFESESAADDAAVRIDVERALAALGDRERAAALLCFGEGCSHGEAAEIMGLPLGTLKSLLARARTALADRLEANHV